MGGVKMNLVELVQITSSENGKVYINGIEGFWSYAKERLFKFHGVSREYFVYYLKELEFRYNF
jgi:transposase